jgi:hypothetical protein
MWSVREVEDTVAVFTVDAVTVYAEECIQSVGITIIITISIKTD